MRAKASSYGLMVLALASIVSPGAWPFIDPSDPGSWEEQIRDYERRDRLSPPAPGQILFVGSSSFRLWSSLEQDMAPLHVINRGFGGAYIAHIDHFADRIVFPYAPVAIVMYAGDNDLARTSHKTPEQIRDDFVHFADRAAKTLPGTPIYFLSIKPSPARADRWPLQERANRLIREEIGSRTRITYVDVASAMLDDARQMRAELYEADGLHLSAAGYALWTSILRPILEQELGTRPDQ